jgi:hypothetical protein
MPAIMLLERFGGKQIADVVFQGAKTVTAKKA